MKNKLTLLFVLFFLFDYSVLCQDLPVMPVGSVKDNTENLTADDLRKLPKGFYKSTESVENILEPSLTQINFDDIIFPYNAITISPNRYAGVSFYSPYSGYSYNTYLTSYYRYSTPNSLIVGYDDGQNVYSVDSMIIEFAQPAKDVAFLWGRSDNYYNAGWIDIYTVNNTFVTTVSVSVGNWLSISLNQYSKRIKKLILRRPYSPTSSVLGHIYLDNFQFNTVITQSPIGTFESVSIQEGAALGWSADPDNQSASNLVDCYVNSVIPANFIGRVTANLPGGGAPYPGNHRFSMPIPVQYRDGNQHNLFCYGLDVTGGDSPTLLTGSPKSFRFNPPIGWIGSISSVNENELSPNGGIVDGWSLDTDLPERSNFIHFYIDGPAGTGTFVGEAFADIPRPDVNQQTQLPGNHGYEFQIPDQYRNGVQHTIYAYGIDLTGDYPRLLQGSPKTFTLFPRIVSVILEPIDSTLDYNPNAGGERRIFPDKQTPNDTTIRRKVRVKAEILPVQANRTVYFKSFDLDDPSTDAAPVDSNGVQGNDNRGERDAQGNWTSASAGTLVPIGSCAVNQNGIGCTTDSSGVAIIEFWTTMQPGDNFTVAASLEPSYLNGITVNGTNLADSNNNLISQTTYVPPARAKRTEMLTVWRKLHIEVDRMENVPNNNAVNGNRVTGNFQFTGYLNPGTISVPIVTPPLLEEGRFAQGRIVFNNLSFQVDGNSPTSVNITNNTPTRVRITANDQFILYDDDDYNSDDNLNLDGDSGEAIIELPNILKHVSDADGINSDNTPRNIFASAYIMPEYIWSANAGFNQSNVTFNLNINYTPINANPAEIVVNQQRGSNGSERDDFWVAYVLLGYQGRLVSDFDGYTIVPNPMPGGPNLIQQETGDAGIVPQLGPMCDCLSSSSCPASGATCVVVPRGGEGAIIFQEVVRDIVYFYQFTRL